MTRKLAGLVGALGFLLVGACAFVSRRQPGAAQARVRPGVFQTTDFNAAQQVAQAENKPMILDFYADWCKPCKVMEKKVFTHPEVMQEAQKSLTVKVDSDVQRDLVQQFKVTQYPTLIWTDASGKEKFRQVGALDASGFLKAMQQHR